MATPKRVMDGRLESLLPLEVMSSCGGGSLPNKHCMVPTLIHIQGQVVVRREPADASHWLL